LATANPRSKHWRPREQYGARSPDPSRPSGSLSGRLESDAGSCSVTARPPSGQARWVRVRLPAVGLSVAGGYATGSRTERR
jgi:hypothetical protein